MTENTEIQNLTYEQAITELDTIINNIENNNVKLNDSISLYERGTKLKKHCENILNTAKLTVDKLQINNNVENSNLTPFNNE